jgi:protein involved in polysaccharide export with SLBB domain
MSNNIESQSNVLLESNDLIQLFSINEFADPYYVEIFGEIRKEGRYVKYGGMSLQDLLYLSGGIKPSAEFGRLEISSIVDIDSARKGLKPTRTVVRAYSIQPNLTLDTAAANVMLKPYDQIFVRRNPTFEVQQNVQINGLVKYPGIYPRLSKFERLSSYVERAGGFKDNANLSGAVLFRKKTDLLREKIIEKPVLDSTGNPILDSLSNSVKNVEAYISIDLLNALKYKDSKYDIVLQEGDVVFVPEINPFVSVVGSVQSPLKISFDKDHSNLMYYIDKAGGFGVRPWRKRIYVTYANGKSRRTKTFLFIKKYPKVEEGAIVMVPIKPEGQELGDAVKSIFIATIPVVLTTFLLRSL